MHYGSTNIIKSIIVNNIIYNPDNSYTKNKTPMDKIPVSLVAGFLGAGKTTLLNHILNGEHGRRIGVLVNDFGEINIDSQLITRVEGETISLTNGCVCCSIRDDLVAAIKQLLQLEPRPDMIVVETSGVSDPKAAAMAIVMSTHLAAATELDAIITVIDASEVLDLDEMNEKLVEDQVAVADIAIINKTDLVPALTREKVARQIREIAPQSRIIEAVHADVPLELLLGLTLHTDWSGFIDGKTEEAPGHEHHHHTDHALSYSGYSWRHNEPLAFEAIYRTFQSLPVSIFRSKGILYIHEVPDKRVILQMTGKRVTLAKGEPWEETTPSSQVVAIGAKDKIDTGDLDERFKACLSDVATPSDNPMTEAVIEILRRGGKS